MVVAAASDGAGGDDNAHAKYRVRFNSILPQYRVEGDEIAVGGDVRTSGMSKIINYLLEGAGDDSGSEDGGASEEKSGGKIRFDFLIKNRFLRTSLSSYVLTNNLSAESTIVIDYLPKATKPEPGPSGKTLPDWVSSLFYDVPSGVLFSGCYDGAVRGMSAGTLDVLGSETAHKGPVRCVASGAGGLVASGGLDCQLLLHKFSGLAEGGGGDGRLKTMWECSGGHSSSVESVAWERSGSDAGSGLRLASGDFGGGLCLWTVGGDDQQSSAEQEAEAASSSTKKKQKTSSSTSSSSCTVLSPLFNAPLHTSSISGIAWTGSGSGLITGSFDYSVRSFDVESQNPLLTLNGNRVVTCLAKSNSSDIVATGHSDSRMKLWDMRVKGNGVDDSVLTADTSLRPSHKSWVSSISFSPSRPHNLCSCSHDGTVKTWDVRCSLPLHTVKAHVGEIGDRGERAKALAVCYGATEGTLYSGGTDCQVLQWGTKAGQ